MEAEPASAARRGSRGGWLNRPAAGACRGDHTDLLQYLVGAEVLEGELLVQARRQGGLHIRLEAQVDKVDEIEGPLGTTLVGPVLHALMSLKKMLADDNQHGGTLR
jgi:hypothetical protein